MSLVKREPSIYLKVETDKIKEKYLRGEYKNIRLARIPKLKGKKENKNIVDIYSRDNSQQVWSTRAEGREIVIATSGCRLYDQEEFCLECLWCRYPINRDHVPVLIPHKMKEEKVDGQIVEIYYGTDHHCNFNCAMAHIENSNNYNRDNELLLLNLFEFIHPGKKLVSANDYRLLKKNGGSLDYDKWKVENYRYKNSHKAILLPHKIEYERLKFR